jgi:hypothetical protein
MKRPRSVPGEPMDLSNMDANGIRSLDVSCWVCHCQPERRWPEASSGRLNCTEVTESPVEQPVEAALRAAGGAFGFTMTLHSCQRHRQSDPEQAPGRSPWGDHQDRGSKTSGTRFVIRLLVESLTRPPSAWTI